MKNEEYLKEVLARLDAQLEEVKKAETPLEISSCERKIFPLLTELQMVIPRIGDDVVKLTHKRRRELSRGV